MFSLSFVPAGRSRYTPAPPVSHGRRQLFKPTTAFFPSLTLASAAVLLHGACAVGGLLNATCGNATELIIALFALMGGQIEVVKCSLLGSVLSNLLLVLGTSLFCGGVVNLGSDQPYDRVRACVPTTSRR
jgi:calcium/proton exchanger cax